ncbi:MAG: hypothetical protein MZU91_03055 [Desulfosudis oleivorans]|nr:hypothetical protein [Desulfosudis oleivorans]
MSSPARTFERLLEGVPQLQFVGLMKMASGTTLTLSLKEPYTLESTRADRDEGRITFVMSTSGQQSPRGAGTLTARSLFDAGNRARSL